METMQSSSQQQRTDLVDTGIQTDSEELVASTNKGVEEDDRSSLCSFSFFEESSNCSTRRNSFTPSSVSSGLATPFHLLFGSTTSSSSNLDSPTVAPVESNVLNGLDQLLKRITNERFLELRRIQLGERPVTGGSARASIEHFFDRAINGPTVQERNEEETQNRPENVANDVESLLQLSRVSSAIQNGFRSRLEATLTGRSISTPATSSNAPTSRSVRQPISSSRDPTSTQSVNQSRVSSNVTRVIPPPPPPPLPQEGNRTLPRSSMLQQNSVLQSSVEASVQLLTESIATDITRLQSLQVVSTMLQDDFRNELENLVQQRVESLGGNHRTLPVFQRQRPAPIQRQVRLRTISEQAATNTSSVETHELRRELDEMKQLLKMTMEIQLDTQRAIRQEVSAVFHAFMSEFLTRNKDLAEESQHIPQAISSLQQNRTSPVERGQCVICIDQSIDTVFYQCGHMCACNSCALHLKVNGKTCPMCRAPIRDVIRAYANNEL